MANQENTFRAHLHIATFCEKVLREADVYWWDLYLNEQLVTRMPLRVMYQRSRTLKAGS
jgi:hypothetical protein